MVRTPAVWRACPANPWVAPRLPGVDPVAFSPGQLPDGHLVCLGSAFDRAVTGGGQVAVPVAPGTRRWSSRSSREARSSHAPVRPDTAALGVVAGAVGLELPGGADHLGAELAQLAGDPLVLEIPVRVERLP